MANLRIFYAQCSNEKGIFRTQIERIEFNEWMEAIQQVIQALRESRMRRSFLTPATSTRPVRTLTVRVAEARNLPIKDIGGAYSFFMFIVQVLVTLTAFFNWEVRISRLRLFGSLYLLSGAKVRIHK